MVNRLIAEKLMSMSEAIREFVHDKDAVYMAGFTHLIPQSAGHEIIRQRMRTLTPCKPTPDIIYDQMAKERKMKDIVAAFSLLDYAQIHQSSPSVF